MNSSFEPTRLIDRIVEGITLARNHGLEYVEIWIDPANCKEVQAEDGLSIDGGKFLLLGVPVNTSKATFGGRVHPVAVIVLSMDYHHVYIYANDVVLHTPRGRFRSGDVLPSGPRPFIKESPFPMELFLPLSGTVVPFTLDDFGSIGGCAIFPLTGSAESLSERRAESGDTIDGVTE